MDPAASQLENEMSVSVGCKRSGVSFGEYGTDPMLLGAEKQKPSLQQVPKLLCVYVTLQKIYLYIYIYICR